jgi:hypothetical protein
MSKLTSLTALAMGLLLIARPEHWHRVIAKHK